jgi:hypothetical protein
MIAYYGERIEEVIVAEQGELTEEERALLDLLRGSFAASWRKPPEDGGP